VRRWVLALTLLAAAVPARADVTAWLRDAALPRLGVGVEAGMAMPTDPFDFSTGWDDSRGCGAFVRCALTPTVDVLLRAERDRFAFDAGGFRDAWISATAVTGTDATMDVLMLGLRAHQARGVLRGHATLYAGIVRRTGRRASVTYDPPYYTTPYTVPWGEPDATNRAFGFGVGATWAIPRLPDPTAEARVIWLVEGPEALVPLRVGVTLP
jgi:hypothetical protein